MSKRANYRQIPSLLQRRAPFRGNSMRAERGTDGTYSVYSYTTLIVYVNANGGIWVTQLRYSPTSSRHTNLCRAWL